MSEPAACDGCTGRVRGEAGCACEMAAAEAHNRRNRFTTPEDEAGAPFFARQPAPEENDVHMPSPGLHLRARLQQPGEIKAGVCHYIGAGAVWTRDEAGLWVATRGPEGDMGDGMPPTFTRSEPKVTYGAPPAGTPGWTPLWKEKPTPEDKARVLLERAGYFIAHPGVKSLKTARKMASRALRYWLKEGREGQ